VGRGTEKEHTILDEWFARQRRRWWKQWRWVVVAVITLLVARISIDVFECWFLYSVDKMHGFTGFTGYMNTLLAYPIWRFLQDDLWPYIRYEEYFWLPVVILVASTYTLILIPPGEVSIAFSKQQIHQRLLFKARRVFWYWAVFLVFLVPVLNTIATHAYRILAFKSNKLAIQDVIELLVMMGAVLFLIEWQIALLLRIPYSITRLPLFAMPLATTMYAIYAVPILNTLGHLNATCYAPFPGAEVFPCYGDIWIAALHLGALAAGLYLAWRSWPRIIHSGNVIRWWLLIEGVWFCLVLPKTLWVASNVWLARAIYGTSAIFHGVYIGNPFAGWSQLRVTWANPYTVDWESLPYLWSKYIELGKHVGAEPLYQHNYGIVFSPWIYIPLWAGLLWIVLYYSYSIFIIWRANNTNPPNYHALREG